MTAAPDVPVPAGPSWELRAHGSGAPAAASLPYGDRLAYGERLAYGDLLTHGDPLSYGDRLSHGDPLSYGDSQPYGDHSPSSDHPPSSDPSPYGDHRPYADHLPPWFNVRLTFDDGTRVDVLAVVSEGGVAIEDMRADPPLALDGLAGPAHWLEGPLREACRVVAEQHAHDLPPAADARPAPPEAREPEPEPEPAVGHRAARPGRARGSAGRRIAVEAYRAAQEEGRDPVLAVMGATGHSRRKSLKLIAAARDAGQLPSRHARRR